MKHIDHINILTKRYYPWEVLELQNLIADGLRSLKCKSVFNEVPTVTDECRTCEYRHLCKTLRRVYEQIDNAKAERHSELHFRQSKNFLKKASKKY